MLWPSPGLWAAASALGLVLLGLLVAPAGLLVLMVLVPMELTGELAVEREILANFRIRWMLVGKAWHRRWTFPDLVAGLADHRQAVSRAASLQASAGALRPLWPQVQRRLIWRRVAVDLVVGQGSEPHLAAVAAGWLWGAVPLALAGLGVPPRAVRLGIRPAGAAEPGRGRVQFHVGLRPIHGLILGWQAYRLLRRARPRPNPVRTPARGEALPGSLSV